MALGIGSVFTKSLTAASANNIAQSQSPGAAALTLNGSAVSGGVATIDTASATNSATGRKVVIVSGGNDSAINFIVVGTNGSGNVITDTVPGTNAGTAVSNLDFVTVTSITPSAAIAGTVTAGTNTVGSSPWWMVNSRGYAPINVSALVELVSGAANYTVEYTLDDPNGLESNVTFPLPFSGSSPAALVAASATKDGLFNFPMAAIRLTINSGTGVLRTRFLQGGAG